MTGDKGFDEYFLNCSFWAHNKEFGKICMHFEITEFSLQNICNYCIIAKIAEIEGAINFPAAPLFEK